MHCVDLVLLPFTEVVCSHLLHHEHLTQSASFFILCHFCTGFRKSTFANAKCVRIRHGRQNA